MGVLPSTPIFLIVYLHFTKQKHNEDQRICFEGCYDEAREKGRQEGREDGEERCLSKDEKEINIFVYAQVHKAWVFFYPIIVLYFFKMNCIICKVVHLVIFLCTKFSKVYIYNLLIIN